MKKMFAILLSLSLILIDSSLAFAGKSYSSGGSRSGGSSAGSGSRSSGRTYSSGSRATPSAPKSSFFSPKPSIPKSIPSVPSTPKSSGRTYSSNSNSNSTNSSASKPFAPSFPKGKSSGFNDDLSQSAKREESRIRYQAANTPKSTYTPPGPSSKPVAINSDSPQVQNVRRHVTYEKYTTYDNRASTFYRGGQPIYYNDSFSPFLWGWIMSDAINSQQRALWMYHHQNDMDQARYQAMIAKDARLQAEIETLKAQNLARDPSYVPTQMQENPDLMYNKEFVEASYNPVLVEDEGSGVIAFMFWTIVILSIGGIFLYFMFVKEY